MAKSNRYVRISPVISAGGTANTTAAGAGATTPPTGSAGTPPTPPTLIETLMQYIGASNLRVDAHTIHRSFWFGVVGFYATQLAAGWIDKKFGHGAMLIWEFFVMIALGYFWTLPEILAAEIVLASFNAVNDGSLLVGDAVSELFAKTTRWVLNSMAYTICLVVTILLVFDINIDFGEMAMLLFIGTLIGILTFALEVPGKRALEIALSALLACAVKVLLTHIGEVPDAGLTQSTRNWVVTHAGLISFLAGICFFAGTSWIKTSLIWAWDNVIVKGFALLTMKKIGGLLLLGLLLFAIFTAFNPKAALPLIDGWWADWNDAATQSANGVNTPSAGAGSNATTTTTSSGVGKFLTPSEPVEIDVVITKFHQDVCDSSLPNGKHTVTAAQMELRMISQNVNQYSGQNRNVPSILGNQTGYPKEDLPYQKADYYFGVLFNNKPSGSEIKIQNHCIKNISFNIPNKLEQYYDLKTRTNTLHLTIQ